MPATGPPLADLTTLRVGGPARRLVTAASEDELVAVVREADAAGAALLLIGGGSNLLVADAGFDGLAVRVATAGIARRRHQGAERWTVAAGVPWADVVDAAVAEGLAGIEALAGIPGSTGATPVQNVGAYGCEVADILAEVRVLDRRTGRVGVLRPSQLDLGYRTSRLKRSPGTWTVLSVTLQLTPSPRSRPVRYAELARALGVEVGEPAALADVRAAVLALRAGKGMLLDAADHDTWSAGSFFTNPIVPVAAADALPATAPRWPHGPGTVKVSAAWLIEQAGFTRGWRVRPGAPAGLSQRHVLALTNRGGATAADVLELARAVRAGVLAAFGVLLDPEPVLVGCAL